MVSPKVYDGGEGPGVEASLSTSTCTDIVRYECTHHPLLSSLAGISRQLNKGRRGRFHRRYRCGAQLPLMGRKRCPFISTDRQTLPHPE